MPESPKEVETTENPPKAKDQEMKAEDDASWSEGATPKTSDTESKDSNDKKEIESTNDGVKILEEVFGKATVSGDGKDEETKKSSPDAGVSFGPVPPAENEYDPDEIKKAEEFKTQGNDFFKSKCIFLIVLTNVF